jgi:hypothetical protein
MPCSATERDISLSSISRSSLKPVRMPQRPFMSPTLRRMVTWELVTERMPVRGMPIT